MFGVYGIPQIYGSVARKVVRVLCAACDGGIPLYPVTYALYLFQVIVEKIFARFVVEAVYVVGIIFIKGR
jgi:hypothetical protein